jgi:hypothetical protein
MQKERCVRLAPGDLGSYQKTFVYGVFMTNQMALFGL